MIDNVERIADIKEHQKLVSELRSLRSKIQKSNEQLKPFVKSIAAIVDGHDIDNMINDAKEKFMVNINA